MKRWVFALLVFVAVYARYHPNWRQEDIRVEGVALGEELDVVRSRVPSLHQEGEEWLHDCPPRGVRPSFESWVLRAPHGRVESVRGWHLQVGRHRFAPLETGSFSRLQSLLGPGRAVHSAVYVWPQYRLKVSVESGDSVTLMTLE